MAQLQITLDEQLLHQLFLGNSKESGINALLKAILNQVLKVQASEQLKAEKYVMKLEPITETAPTHTN